MSNSDVPVGDRLFAALSHDVAKRYTPQELASICALVDEAIILIQTYRSKNKFSNLKPSALVIGLFKRFEKVNGKEQQKLTAQCSEEFLCWCKKKIVAGNQTVCQILLNFVYDTVSFGYLGKDFSTRQAGHAHSWIPVASFRQVFNWYCTGVPPDQLTSEFLYIFELRQAMETAFRRVLGFGGASVRLYIPHELIPDILHHNLNTNNFSPPNKLTIKEFMHVYNWTNRSIHMMRTDWTWVVWKAMMVECDFFACPQRSSGRKSIYDNFELSDQLLKKLRCKFVARVKEQNKGFQEFKIYWMQPEAAIVDNNGRPIEISPQTETIQNPCHWWSVKRLVNRIIKHIRGGHK